MIKKEPQKKTISVEVNCDIGRLYGTLNEAVIYLREMMAMLPADASLEEMWTGYEDMHMAFTYSRLETDAEYNNRLELEASREKQRLEDAAREKKRLADIAEYNRLGDKLGMRR